MALDVNTLTEDLKTALDDIEEMNKQEGATPDTVKQAFAEKWANAINKFVTSGEVVFAPNDIAVATTGSATSQTGGNSAEVKKNIS